MQDGITYEDLEDVPSANSCSKCACDFGEIICTKQQMCESLIEEPIVKDDNIDLILTATSPMQGIAIARTLPLQHLEQYILDLRSE